MLLSGGLKLKAAPDIPVRDFNDVRGSMRMVAIPSCVISSSQRSQLRCWDGEDKLVRRVADLAHIWPYGDILIQICGKRSGVPITLT